MELVRLSNAFPHLINARFSQTCNGLGTWCESYAREDPRTVSHSVLEALRESQGWEWRTDFADYGEHGEFKFAVDPGPSGGGTSSRLVWLAQTLTLCFFVEQPYDSLFNAVFVPYEHYIPVGGKEGGNTLFCPSQEKFQAFVLRGVGNVSGTP